MNTLFKVYKYVIGRMFERLFKEAYGISMWFIVEIRKKVQFIIYDVLSKETV